jgi:hypothetical protein
MSPKLLTGECAMKLAKWGLAILLASPIAIVPAVSAQSQDSAQGQQQDALAAAARRAREEKKDQPKAAKVWDNDNIPSSPGTVSVVGDSSQSGAASSDQGDQSAQSQDQAASSADSNEQAQPANDKDKAAKAAEVDADQQQLKSLKTDLDIAQRKLVLDQQMYYGKPDYSSDKAGAAALKDEQDQIAAKQQEIDDLQKKIDALQAESAAAGNNSNSGNSSGASSPSTDQNQTQNQNENPNDNQNDSSAPNPNPN